MKNILQKVFATQDTETNGYNSASRPLLLLVGLAVILMFATIFFVGLRTDRIAKANEEQLFQNFINERQSYIEETLNEIVAMPRAAEALSGSLTPSTLRSDVVQRLADRLKTSDVFITNANSDVLFAEETYTSIDPLKSFDAKPSIFTLLESFTSTEVGTVQSDAFSIRDSIFYLSAIQLNSQNQTRYLIAATPIANHFGDTIRFKMNADILIGAEAPSAKFKLFSTPIQNNAGDTIGWLTWNRSLPGHIAVLENLPLVFVVATSLIIAAILFWKRAQKLSRQLLESQREAEKRALHDSLTGLGNRVLLKNRIEAAQSDMKRGRKGFALHLIDLDRFKEVNDSMGHQAGDKLIQMAASRLKDACRNSDSIARIGGDEFAIVQTDATSPAAAARLSRRIIDQMSRPFNINGADVYSTASVGIATHWDEEIKEDEIMRHADIALYKAKESGRNQYCFFEAEMDAELKQKHQLERELRHALSDPKALGLRVVYQPQVSANGRHIRGMEALVRWQHPKRGSISPAEFIPVAEESGLIITLGDFVLNEAFMTASRWPEITMAVNVSAHELRRDDYPDRVIRLADRYNVRTDQIELEITETVLLEDSPRVTKTVKDLKAAGFRIALDDFGTGYSSLSYLRRHQVDKLKIDQSFVASIGVREDAGAVVQAILNLGEALGLSVTAEGVETPAQRDSLRERGCAYLQGYLFSRPLEEQDIAALVSEFKRRNQQTRMRKIS